ncbi:MAG: septum formation initiator family protein [Patescibacteria group bacterium]
MPLPQRSIEQRIFYSPIFVIFLLIIIALTISGLFKIFYKAQKIKTETAQLQTQVSELNANNKDLLGKKEYFASAYFIEKEARLQLNMKKAGEKVIFIDYSNEKTTNAESLKSRSQLVLNFLDWWAYFFKHGK